MPNSPTPRVTPDKPRTSEARLSFCDRLLTETLLVALGKALAVVVDAYREHQAEREAARQAVNVQAEDDLAAVTARPPVSSDNDLP